jgi:hypothetical protein
MDTFNRHTFQWCLWLFLFWMLITNIKLSNRMRSKMTLIKLARHLPMRANESATLFPSTGCNFINPVLNQFATIDSIGRFHQWIQLHLHIVKIEFCCVFIWLENQWIQLVHSTWIWEIVLHGANRDSGWFSTTSRWHINHLIVVYNSKFWLPTIQLSR